MNELTKTEKRAAKDAIRKGILHRHTQWQNELRALLDKPLGEDENEFDRNMQITKMAYQFYKEAMEMEEFYRNSRLLIGLAYLYREGHLTKEDLASLPEKLAQSVSREL
jgi:hypothetical protein